jgi:PBP1b-binding outer membrane lipoprotein LpoB
MRIRKIAIAAGAAISAAVIIGGCSNQLDDLKGVNPNYPNYAAVYIEPDGFPNIVETCVNGQGFALTTRDYTAIIRMPEWDTFCAKQIGKQATVNGQP